MVFVLLAGCTDDPDGPVQAETDPECSHFAVVDITLAEPYDPPLQMLVDRCRAAGGRDFVACEPTCRELDLLVAGSFGYGIPPDEMRIFGSCTLGDDPVSGTATAAWLVHTACEGER